MHMDHMIVHSTVPRELLLLYTLFIVEIKTGKMPNNIGPTVNNMLKDIVEKKKIIIPRQNIRNSVQNSAAKKQ